MSVNLVASAAFVQEILRLLGRRDARCVGSTSAFSRSSYKHSCLVGFRDTSKTFVFADPERSPVSRQSDSLRWADVALPLGLLFPAQDTKAVPLAPLSRLELRRIARASNRKPESPKMGSPRPRERYVLRHHPGCLPSFKDLCPAAPFRAPGSGLPQNSRRCRRGLCLSSPSSCSPSSLEPFEP